MFSRTPADPCGCQGIALECTTDKGLGGLHSNVYMHSNFFPTKSWTMEFIRALSIMREKRNCRTTSCEDQHRGFFIAKCRRPSAAPEVCFEGFAFCWGLKATRWYFVLIPYRKFSTWATKLYWPLRKNKFVVVGSVTKSSADGFRISYCNCRAASYCVRTSRNFDRRSRVLTLSVWVCMIRVLNVNAGIGKTTRKCAGRLQSKLPYRMR
jgi:hypothetical protein